MDGRRPHGAATESPDELLAEGRESARSLDDGADPDLAAFEHLGLAADVRPPVSAFAGVACGAVVVEQVQRRLLAQLEQAEGDAQDGRRAARRRRHHCIPPLHAFWLRSSRASKRARAAAIQSQAELLIVVVVVAEDGVRLAPAGMAVGEDAEGAALHYLGNGVGHDEPVRR